MYSACSVGSSDVVKFLIKRCPLKSDYLRTAAVSGHVEIMKILFEANCPISIKFESTIYSNSEEITEAAVKSNNIEAVKLAINHGCQIPHNICSYKNIDYEIAHFIHSIRPCKICFKTDDYFKMLREIIENKITLYFVNQLEIYWISDTLGFIYCAKKEGIFKSLLQHKIQIDISSPSNVIDISRNGIILTNDDMKILVGGYIIDLLVDLARDRLVRISFIDCKE